mgnify:CR=1 FL=1
MDYSRVVFENAGEASSTSSPSWAFVGMYAHGKDLIFRLPIGYPRPGGAQPYAAARDLHIAFFKLFRRFRSVAWRNRDRQKEKADAHEDAGAALQAGREWIVRHEEGDVYYYRHFDAFDSLLDAFDELTILGLERRLRLTDRPASDLRYFERTDAGRIYQDDDTFFDDAAFHPATTLTVLPSDLVGLYCFLLRDLREHVWAERDPDPLRDDIRVLAEKFESRHLWPSASCWEAGEWERTRDTVRDKLDIIDRVTALKDEDYHRLYDAVVRFLYPPADTPHGNGILWGLDGFWPVWEWMVLTRLATAEQFRHRLCWIENGNLAPDTIDRLQHDGFQPPLDDEQVLCKNGGDWDTFLTNGKKLGHPYPDAILSPAEFKSKGKLNEAWHRVEKLHLSEGPVVMTLSGTHEYLATTGTPAQAHIRSSVSSTDGEKKVAQPVLALTGAQRPDPDRPEVIAMLCRLGTWSPGPTAYWQYAPFKSYRDAKRKHMGGALLVDAKYKKAEDPGANWAVDHRKQAAYEDALTLSCPDTPAAYSIYICPGQPVAQDSLASLVAREAARRAQFDQEFENQWNKLDEIEAYERVFKDRGQPLKVLDQNTTVTWGNGQKIRARHDLLGKVFPPNEGLLADIDKSRLACSLLGVDRFPGNDPFFFKNWPIRDLVDDMVNAG